MPTLVIDGKTVHAEEGVTVLAAAKKAAVHIPTLCHHEALESWGGCRLCVVDVTRPEWEGWAKLVVACMFPVEDGIIVNTRSERVLATRRVVLDLLLARCPETPLVQRLAAEHGIMATSYVPRTPADDCVLCGLCTRVCDHLGISAISAISRGAGREIAPPFKQPPEACIGCLACAQICPTGFIPYQTSDVRRTIWGKEFEMLRCKKCGRSHITAAQAEYYDNKNGVPMSYFDTCDACKRNAQAKTSTSLTVSA
jgi:bidirectional [NiFe] hydrogenase diaphorase subunit